MLRVKIRKTLRIAIWLPASIFVVLAMLGSSCAVPEPSAPSVAASDVARTRWLGAPDPAFGVVEVGDDIRSDCGEFHGTAERPVIVRVQDHGRCDIAGSYVIVEDSSMERVVMDGSFLALRNSHVSGANTGSMVWVAAGSHDIVILNNEIDHNGTIPSSKDNHGISLGSDSDRVWIVDNHIHDNSGDGIQFCHSCIDKGNGPKAVYISGNEIHNDEENAIDLKEFVGPVVVTRNTMYGYRRGEYSGNGEALRINDEGQQGELWVVANVFRDNVTDINPDRSRARSYLLDNEAGDIRGGAWELADGSRAQKHYDTYEQKYGIRLNPN